MNNDPTYQILEIIGASSVGFDDAVHTALAKAGEISPSLKWFEVISTRGSIESGKIAHWQVTLKIGAALN